MQNFYIFLDYDGVMWGLDLLKKEGFKSLINSLIKYKASKNCVLALNCLIENLKKDYNPIIVISSERRRSFEKIRKSLMENGLVNCEFDATPIVRFKSRGNLVKQYLQALNENENFLIIDDIVSSFKSFSKDKIIKTSLLKGGLTRNLVDKYLNTNEI